MNFEKSTVKSLMGFFNLLERLEIAEEHSTYSLLKKAIKKGSHEIR